MSVSHARRLVLVIGSQCAAAPALSFLPQVAQDLALVLTDPGLGGCNPALDAGPVLIDPSRTALMQAVRAAFDQANQDDGSVLVLAFIGHGIAVDEDFYYLPADGSGQGHFDADVQVSQLLKEGLRDNPNLDGLLVLLDTCHAGVGAAQAAAWQQVGLGRRTHRYELLTSSADQPAYGGVVTRTMIEVLRTGITTAGTTLGSRHLHSVLRDKVPGQRPQRITHDGGGWADTNDQGLWWAHNVGHYSRRPEPAAPAGSAVPARSAYQLQVARIAPEHLDDRDQELADMAAFCTMPDAGPYRYWRAGPWAGKSALMSWFVLHPPAGVSIVSFFITARYAGQNDRVAFTEVVVAQLAELLGEPMPVLTPASREYSFLYLLARAGKQCQASGQRLVLLVDGLDEDRGVTTGPDAHSIAALLPEKPPHGVRIIVAGRPNPPVPDDVPPGHPLYGPAVIFPLAPSAQARVVQNDMQRELSHLLHGSPAEQDLLGLLTAAGGGLSAQDLAELTGQLPWQAQEHLATVAGRSFTPRDSHWRPGQEPEVYVLGHEELQNTATDRIGLQRLNDYRQRLHAWADTYQARHWPDTTPEYLLRGYYRLLVSIGDLTRLVALATDTARHDRMLDLSGGDTAAGTEITTTQTLLLAQPEPDLEAMTLLSKHRNDLTARNTHIPIDLPALWAHLSQPNRAEALARSMTNPGLQAQALTAVAEAVAAAGDPDQAEQIARSITIPGLQAQALTAVATAMAATGDLDRARQLAAAAERAGRSDTDPVGQVYALTEVAEAVAAAGDLDRARQMAAAAERTAQSVTDPYTQERALSAVAKVVAAAGDLDRGEQIARSITDPYTQERALSAVAKVVAAAGDLDRGEQIARSITDPYTQERALSAVAKVVAAAGDLDRGEQIARSITDPYTQERALSAVAKVVAATGDLDRARQLAAAAERAARSVTDPVCQVYALTEVAEVVAAAGDLDRARQLAAAAEQAARALTDLPMYQQVRALTAVAEAVAATGDLDRAEHIARSITDQDYQAQALTAVAKVVAATGDLDRARQLAAAAERAARSVTDPVWQVQALTAVAKVVAATGDLDRARQLAAAAEQAARSLTGSYSQGQGLRAVAEIVAATGDLDRAEHIARSITNLYQWARSMTAVAEVVAATGDLDRARQLAAAAEGAARSVTDPDLREEALTAVAKVVAATGDLDRAERIARSTISPILQARVLIAVAKAVAAAGDLDRARQLAAAAEQTAQSLTGLPVHQQVRALTIVAEAVAATGDLDRAEHIARSITDPDWQAQALTAVAEAVAATGDLDRAEHIARSIPRSIIDQDWQAQALTTVAKAVAATGDLHRAEHIVRSITDQDYQAQALTTVAKAIGPPEARRLLGQALAVGRWWIPLEVVTRLAPGVVLWVVDVVIGNEHSRHTQISPR